MPGSLKHSAKWDRCVADVTAKGGAESPEAVCTEMLGEESYESAAGSGYGQLQRGTESLKFLAAAKPTDLKKAVLPGSGVIGAVTINEDGSWDVPVQLISTGEGNGEDEHYYTDEAMESGPAVFEACKAFANHPSMIQDESQPERVIQEQIGFYHGVHVVSVMEGKALRGKLRLLPPPTPGAKESDLMIHVKSLLRAAGNHAKMFPGKSPLAGFSINADGEQREAEINGKTYKAVTRFVGATSVDMVTFPAARGMILGTLTAAREAMRAGRHKEADAMKKSALKAMRSAATRATDSEATTEDRMKAAGELEAMFKSAEEVAEDDAPADGDDGDDAKKIPPTKEAESEEAKAKASEEAGKKASEEAKKESDEEASKESGHPTAGRLRESAKALKATRPDLARDLESQADAMEKRTGDMSKLRERAHKAEGELAMRKSVDMAHRLIRESGLPEKAIKPEILYGKTESEMKAIIADRSELFESIRAEYSGGGVEGAGARESIRSGESAAVSSTLAKHKIPTK